MFISSVAQLHLQELKDLLWRELVKEENKLQAVPAEHIDRLVHRPKLAASLAEELALEGEDEDFDFEYVDEEEADVDGADEE